MEGFDGHPGTAKLATVLSERMRKETESPFVLDFGEIQGNYSLVTNTFPVPIPKGDYSVCRSINGYPLGTSESSWIGHIQGISIYMIILRGFGDTAMMYCCQN